MHPVQVRIVAQLHFSGCLLIHSIEQKRTSECSGYYENLLEQVDTLDSIAFRQIELDVNRTFSTRKFMKKGQAALRRVLQAYSIRNVAIGYCQVCSHRFGGRQT